jgi:hypothetical protein
MASRRCRGAMPTSKKSPPRRISMNIINFERYRKAKDKKLGKLQLSADNDNGDNAAVVTLQDIRFPYFWSESGERLTVKTSDSGVIVKEHTGYPHRFP